MYTISRYVAVNFEFIAIIYSHKNKSMQDTEIAF